VSEINIERRSKDKMIGNRGRNFIDWIQKKGCYMMNGMKKEGLEWRVYICRS